MAIRSRTAKKRVRPLTELRCRASGGPPVHKIPWPDQATRTEDDYLVSSYAGGCVPLSPTVSFPILQNQAAKIPTTRVLTRRSIRIVATCQRSGAAKTSDQDKRLLCRIQVSTSPCPNMHSGRLTVL